MSRESGVAWAPNLPHGWGGAALRWIAEIYAGGTPERDNPEYWSDGSIPWLNSGAVSDWAITKPSELISESGFSQSSARWVPSQSVVIGLAGQGKTKGTSARLEIRSTTNQSMAAIVPGPKLEYRFLHFWLSSNYQSIRNLAGGDKRDGLNLQHLAGIECPLPPITLQAAIADYLDRETAQIDTLIAKQEQLIATLRERRVATIGGAFASLTDAIYVQLRRLATRPIDSGLDEQSDASNPVEWPRFVRTTDIMDVFTLDDSKRVTVDPTHVGEATLDPGDLVLTRAGATIGKSYMHSSGEPAAYAGYLVRIRPDQKRVASRYLAYWTQSTEFSDTIAAGAIKSTIENFSASKYRSVRVPITSLERQKRLIVHLDDACMKIDTLIAKAERFIELSKERRAALITAAVTGQLEIPAA